MRNTFFMTIVFAMLAGCRSPGLPPEPPEHDAANPEAGVVEGRSQANPFTRSAFEGVKLDGAGGHEHHHHGHGAKKGEPAKGEAPAKTPEASSHESHRGGS
jgi:hypothetical protein